MFLGFLLTRFSTFASKSASKCSKIASSKFLTGLIESDGTVIISASGFIASSEGITAPNSTEDFPLPDGPVTIETPGFMARSINSVVKFSRAKNICVSCRPNASNPLYGDAISLKSGAFERSDSFNKSGKEMGVSRSFPIK